MVSSELYGNNQRRTYWTVIITAYHTRDNTVQQPMVDGIKHQCYWIKKGYRSIKMVSFYVITHNSKVPPSRNKLNRLYSPLLALSPLYSDGLALMKNCRRSSHKLIMIKSTLNPLYCSLYGISMQHHHILLYFFIDALITTYSIAS